MVGEFPLIQKESIRKKLTKVKKLIVTGATGGIGSEIARLASANDYKVGLIDTDEEKLTSLSKQINNSVPLLADVTSEESIKTALNNFSEIPDALVNCAGIVRYGSLLEQNPEDFTKVFEVNLLGCFIVSCAVVKLMVKNNSGTIVNVSSISGGKHPAIGTGAYAATKAGIVMLSEQMSLEWGKDGIRVNAISPGFINTGMSAPHYKDNQERKKRESMVPIGRLGKAEDIAKVALFLLSEDSSYIHGENILVDGGVMNTVLSNISRN